VGIIGAGNIAARHVEGYRAGGAEVVAIADIEPAMLARRATGWGVERTFTDYQALLGLPDIDAVSVCTPNAVHGAATIAAAAAGKHVLCEKPVSLSLDEADRMIAACAEAGVLLQVNHHLRSAPAVQQAKALIDDGSLGRITHLRLRQSHDWGGSSAPPPSFRTLASAGGGTLLDNGCHLFDLLRHLAGDVDQVYCRSATLGYDVEVEDTAIVSLRLASGALATVETAWTATGWDEGFWVWGTQGALEWTNRTGRPVLRLLDRGVPGTDWDTPRATSWEHAGSAAIVRHVVGFLAAIRGEGPVLCSGADGKEAVRLVLASYESARTGRTVMIG
jgi:predicted dehydrogenase